MVNISEVVYDSQWGRKSKLCCDLDKIIRSSFIWHAGFPKWIWKMHFL